MSTSPWSREPNLPIIVRSTPALLLNNLSMHGTYLCYARRDEVIVTSGDRSPRKHPPSGPKATSQQHVIQQAKFCTLGNSSYLVVASTVGVQLYNMDGNKLLNFFLLNRVVEDSPEKFTFARGIATVPTNDHLIVGTSSGSLLVLTLSPSISLELQREVQGHKSAIVTVAANSTLLVSADDTGEIILRDPHDAYREVGKFKGYGSVCTSIAFASSEVLVAAYSTGHLRYFRVGVLKALHAEVCAHARCISAIDVHPSQPLVATVGEDSYLCIWTVPDFEAKGGGEVSLLYSDKVTDHMLTGVHFHRDKTQRIAATAYDAETIQIWSRT